MIGTLLMRYGMVSNDDRTMVVPASGWPGHHAPDCRLARVGIDTP